MQIVIDIDPETYNDIKKGKIYSSMRDVPQESVLAIANGTPLPKGHGRLIDAVACLNKAWQNFFNHEDEWEKKDEDYIPIGRLYDQNGFECCQQTIVNSPTIIEADKE